MTAAVASRGSKSIEQPRRRQRTDRNHKKINAAPEHPRAEFGYCLLTGNLGNHAWIPFQQVIECLDNIDSRRAQRALSRRPARTAQRGDNFHILCRTLRSASRACVLRSNAAVADQRDFFGHSRIPVNFHCDSSSIV